MGKQKDTSLDRRDFIKHAVAGTTALTASSSLAADQAAVAPQSDARPPDNTPRDSEVLTQGSSGSDYMVDVLKSLALDYVCVNPGSSFRGLHESIVNYGGNTAPEMITCCHEESAVAMAHGYFKIEGKPLAVFGDGEQTRAFTYIQDVAPVMADAPFNPKALNQVFNVGADVPYTVNRLAEVVCQAMGVKPEVAHLEARNEVKHAFSSHDKLHQVFGFQPRFSLEEGVERMARWAKGMGPRRSKLFGEVEILKNMPQSWRNELELAMAETRKS